MIWNHEYSIQLCHTLWYNVWINIILSIYRCYSMELLCSAKIPLAIMSCILHIIKFGTKIKLQLYLLHSVIIIIVCVYWFLLNILVLYNNELEVPNFLKKRQYHALLIHVIFIAYFNSLSLIMLNAIKNWETRWNWVRNWTPLARLALYAAATRMCSWNICVWRACRQGQPVLQRSHDELDSNWINHKFIQK